MKPMTVIQHIYTMDTHTDTYTNIHTDIHSHTTHTTHTDTYTHTTHTAPNTQTHIHTHTQRTTLLQCPFFPLSRSGYFTYDRDETVFGIPVYRFVIPKEELLNKTLNPANVKYWMDGPSGVLNLTAVFPLSELEVARVTACGGGGL